MRATQEAVSLLLSTLGDSPGDPPSPDRAKVLVSLGRLLAGQGRQQEALEATADAVEIYRKLVDQRPAVFGHELVQSLESLGHRLSALGQHQQAEDATKEAGELLQQLAQERPRAG